MTDDKLINKVDSVTLFWYIVIFILVLFIFTKMTIGLNILVGLFVAIGILCILYNDYHTVQNNAKELINRKTNLIYPHLKKSIKHADLINFLFSIQDLYVYNPQAYEEMMEHIDYILMLHSEVMDNNEIAGSNYELMKDQKNNALNALQSILLNMARNTQYDEKLKKSTIILEQMLNKYLEDTYIIHERNLYENGYHTNMRTIERGPIGYDNQSKDVYSDHYQLFQ